MGSTIRHSDLMGLSYGFARGPGEKRCDSPIKTQISDISDEELSMSLIVTQEYNSQDSSDKKNQKSSAGHKYHPKDGGLRAGSSDGKTSVETTHSQTKDVRDCQRANISHKAANPPSIFRQQSEVINSDELFGPGDLTVRCNQDFHEKPPGAVQSGNRVGNTNSNQPLTMVSVKSEGKKLVTGEQAPFSCLTLPSSQKQGRCEAPISPYARHSSGQSPRPRSFPCFENQHWQGENDKTNSVEVSGMSSNRSPVEMIHQEVGTIRLKKESSTSFGQNQSFTSLQKNEDVRSLERTTPLNASNLSSRCRLIQQPSQVCQRIGSTGVDTVDGSVITPERVTDIRDPTGKVSQKHKLLERPIPPFDKQTPNIGRSLREGKETDHCKETLNPSLCLTTPPSEKLEKYEEQAPVERLLTGVRHSQHKTRPRSFPCYEKPQRQNEDDGTKSLETASTCKLVSPSSQYLKPLCQSVDVMNGTAMRPWNTKSVTAGDTIDGRQKIGMKPIVSDLLTTPGDAVICLWSTQNVHTGEHSLLSVAGPVIEDWDNFKHQVALDQVVETKGGNLETGRILHCKYDHVSRHEIASVVIKCIAFTERKKVAIIVFPLEYFDEVQDKPEMVTEALMIAISVTQKIHRYAQHLRKLVICLNSEGKEKQCRQEFVSVRNRSFKRRKCVKCEGKNAVRLSPKSRGPCTRECAMFCMNCLQQVEHCQHHGPCFTPIGHENSFAILVSGFDRSVTNARVFKKETKEMARLLQSAEHVGLRKDNVLVINPGRAGKEEEMKSRVLAAFRRVKSQIDRTKPSSFIFYFSGHNSTGLVLGKPNDVLIPRELKKEFHKLKVDEITSVLDCCYSGGSGLTQQLDSEDYTVSMCSLEGVDSLMFLPRLWNLQQDLRSPGSKVTRIYQLSSSVASEKSFLRDTKSVFTDALISIVMGDCPLRDLKCEHCNDFRRRARRADGIFLNDLHDSLTLHVGLLESKQHPELRRNDDMDILFAYLAYLGDVHC